MTCKRNLFFVLILGGILILGACAQISKTVPDDFRLYYYWNTGALPPEYYYQYEIEIGPDGDGTLTYQKGYKEDEGQGQVFSFRVDAQDWDDFYAWLQTNKILRSTWKETSDILLGGSTTSVKIQANGKKYVIPSVSVLSQNDRSAFYELEDQIEQLVPDEIWAQIKE